ncbi:GSU2403 family nucleotidyltransferase fold protein [Nocardia sp. NPDC050793]|uniref:GSU2403 family nucleotidyltransferase fold protein n=1 Tax=Nocardia sp. NPDC050793 TaxID=3155159 RepID=UPI0033D54DA4
MNNPGAVPDSPFNLLVRTRTVLLDALEALAEHRRSVIVIGAQAVYLHTGGAQVAIAEATKDSDVALDTRNLGSDPTINAAMEKANFVPNPQQPQPGAWMSPDGIPVDIMVPEALAGKKSRRRVHKPPHDKMAMRRARGLEAAVVDYSEIVVPSLAPGDDRAITANVAGPAALLVAKCHKIAERINDPKPDRLKDKDAHDIYRILVKFQTAELAATFTNLLADAVSAEVTNEAVDHLHALFAAGPDATGSDMAGRAEEGVGEPEQVATAISFLASDLVEAIRAAS